MRRPIEEPERLSALLTCIRHPGLVLTMISAPVARTAAGLAVPELSGRIGLYEVVNPGRATAELVLDLAHLQPGDRL